MSRAFSSQMPYSLYYKGWGLYSIFGFGEEVTHKPTSPILAITYHDVNYWNNSALAEALWDGSWTNSSGEKVSFNLQTMLLGY